MTLKDIAGMAGVSVATVSYVLNNKDNKVSAEVAARVRSIIKEVNYQPNTMAKALRSSKSRIIGVLTEDLSVWQVGSIVQGITHYAEAHDYSVVISDLALKEKIQNRYDDIYQYRGLIDKAISRLKGTQVGGIVFVGMHDRSITGLVETDMPLVYAYCSSGSQDDVQVCYDNRRISREVVAMLLAHYSEQVGIIDGPIQSAPARQRMAGVEEAYAQAGIPMNLALRGCGNWEYESGAEACRAMLDSGYPMKAVYAFNDLMALGAIRAIQARGLRVPEDIRVIGFDDVSFCEYSDPPLTTVHVPLDEVGYESAAALTALLEKGQTMENRICLPCRVVWRASCPCLDGSEPSGE